MLFKMGKKQIISIYYHNDFSCFFSQVGQYVFEETFNLRFSVPFEQNNTTQSSQTLPKLRADQLETVRRLNALDIELYYFAEKLMYQRFNKLKAKDPQFEDRFAHLGELQYKSDINWNLDFTTP